MIFKKGCFFKQDINIGSRQGLRSFRLGQKKDKTTHYSSYSATLLGIKAVVYQ